MKTKKKKAPSMPGMIQVTPKNRSRLEKQLGFEIGVDVDYVLPTEDLNLLMDDPEAWEEQ